MNSIQVLIALSVLLGLAVGQSPFLDCGSKMGQIQSVNVSGCTANPCLLKKGTNVSVEMKFVANSEITAATTVVHGIIAGLPVPFPLPDANACHFMKCPLQAKSQVDYKAFLEVKSSYPSISLVVEWELMPASGSDPITCFKTPVKIVE